MDSNDFNTSYSSDSELSCLGEAQNVTYEIIQSEDDVSLEEYTKLKKHLEEERSTSAKLREKISHYKKKSSSKCSENQHSSLMKTREYDEMKRKLCEASTKLVLEGEKSIKLALQVEKNADQVLLLKQEIEKFRYALLHGISGGINDAENYLHVALEELLRIRLQESDGMSSTPISSSSDDKKNPTSFEQNSDGAIGSISSTKIDDINPDISGIQKVEKKLCLTRQKNLSLKSKCDELEEKVEIAKEKSHEINMLQQKIAKLVERSRNDQKMRKNIENELFERNKRISALSDHIEKLMMYLKHEVTAKVRSITELSKLQKSFDQLNSDFEITEKRNIRKDEHIAKLQNEGMILEEQLRLMDEKYMELRMKLDWTRSQMEKMLKKREEEIQQLKDKIAMCGSLSAMADKKKVRSDLAI